MLRIFETSRRHLESVDETYWAHWRFATKMGLAMIAAGAAAIIHGVAPFLFEFTGSHSIGRLAARLESRGRKTTVNRARSQTARLDSDASSHRGIKVASGGSAI